MVFLFYCEYLIVIFALVLYYLAGVNGCVGDVAALRIIRPFQPILALIYMQWFCGVFFFISFILSLYDMQCIYRTLTESEQVAATGINV